MATIVPTITAENLHIYREQVERIEDFAGRVHIDLMDGVFTPNTSVLPGAIWWPDGVSCDVHLMFQEPDIAVKELLKLQPDLIIVPAESSFDFSTIKNMQSKTKFGIALLPGTTIDDVREKLGFVEHLLIFSGNLGHQGGSMADLGLLKKVVEAQQINPDLEIGWDGGVNAQNVRQLADAGVDIINSGGYIHHAPDPALAYQALTALLP